MNNLDIAALARQHTTAVVAISRNFDAIAKTVIDERGSWSNVPAQDVLRALLKTDTLDSATAQSVAAAIALADALPGILAKLTPGQKRLISAVEGAVRGQSAPEAMKTLEKLSALAPADSQTRVILNVAQAILSDGAKTLYDPRAFGKLTNFDRGDGNATVLAASAGGAAAEDVAGAVVGGVAGAVTTWWAGSGPGAAGGAVGGAIMFSGKYLCEATKTWWDGTYHGETDPVGPIGGNELPDEEGR